MCKLCIKLQIKYVAGEFIKKWINSADSVRTSNVRDHAQSDQHTHAMGLLHKEKAQFLGQNSASYTPIAQAFSQLPDGERE